MEKKQSSSFFSLMGKKSRQHHVYTLSGWLDKLLSCLQQWHCVCIISAAQTPLRNPHSMAGMAGLILSPLSSHRAQSQAIPQQKARENYCQHRILDDNSPSFPGCTVALKNFLSICIWWTLSIMCFSSGFYMLSAWHILWACASLGAMLVTPHLSQLSAPILTRNNLTVLLGLAKDYLCFLQWFSFPLTGL